MNATALWAVEPGRCELRSETLRGVGSDDVLVQTHFGAVSKGTESLVLAGRVPPDQYEAMRGPHMEGSFRFPVKYGYACSGAVVAGALPVGTRVFCLHPHQDRFVVPVGDVVVHGASMDRAVLAPNLETALNVVWDSGASAGDRIAVVGGGVVGALVAWLLGQMPGSEVTLVDVLPERETLAVALGVGFGLRAPKECDVVIHTSGTEAGAVEAMGAAGIEATVVEASWFGDRAIALPLGGSFHARRLTLKSSQVGRLPPHRVARWSYRRRMHKALQLVDSACLEALISSEGAFVDLANDLSRVVQGTGLCHRIRYL